MKPEQIIEDSIQKAQGLGVQIIRGPLFIWDSSGNLPIACDCSGAVLVAYGKATRNFPKGWLRELCIDILEKDTYWWWRFNFGFNQGVPFRCIQKTMGNVHILMMMLVRQVLCSPRNTD